MSGENREPAISIQNFSKRFGALDAVQDLSLEIEQGEFFGLLGPNGAGKTTTIGAIAGLVRPSSGSIRVLGLDSQHDYQQVHRHIGLSFQEILLDVRFLNVEEILIYQAGYFGISPRNAQPRVDLLLKQFELEDKRTANVQQLSGGQKRRLTLAKALLHDPDIIILDEPTAGADVQMRHRLWDSLRSTQYQKKTVLLTTHYLEEAEVLCDRVGIIDHGRLIAVGTPDELKREHDASSLEALFLKLVAAEETG